MNSQKRNNFVAYYTIGTKYEELVPRLRNSFIKYDVNYDILGIPNLGDWNKNTHYKPTFIKNMLQKYEYITYIDIDAELCGQPNYFEYIKSDIGVPVIDWGKYGRNPRKEILSGTLYFKRTQRVIELVNKWILLCDKDKRTWDQKLLATILPKDYNKLPDEYCMIFDSMYIIKKPIIKHHQASRKFKKDLI